MLKLSENVLVCNGGEDPFSDNRELEVAECTQEHRLSLKPIGLVRHDSLPAVSLLLLEMPVTYRERKHFRYLSTTGYL